MTNVLSADAGPGPEVLEVAKVRVAMVAAVYKITRDRVIFSVCATAAGRDRCASGDRRRVRSTFAPTAAAVCSTGT